MTYLTHQYVINTMKMVIKMRYIPINEIEKILETKQIEKIIKTKTKKYTLNEYIINIESYIYAYLMLDLNNDNIIYIMNCIGKYIEHIIIPLAEKDSLIFLKSKICEILLKTSKNIKTEINNECTEYIQAFPYNNLYNKFNNISDKIKKKIISEKSVKYLIKYMNIIDDQTFLYNTYYTKENLREKILNTELLKYFYLENLPKKFIYEENIFISIVTIKENISFINQINSRNYNGTKYILIKEYLLKMSDTGKKQVLTNPNFKLNNSDLLIYMMATMKDKKNYNINEIANIKNLDYENYKLLYSFFTKDEIQTHFNYNLNLNNISALKGMLVYLEPDQVIKLVQKQYINKYRFLEYLNNLKMSQVIELLQNINIITYLKKYNYILLIKKLNLTDKQKLSLINNITFRTKYKVKKAYSLIDVYNKVNEDIIKKIEKKSTNINMIDSLIFMQNKDYNNILEKNIKPIIEKLCENKYKNTFLDNETSIFLLKLYLSKQNTNVKIKICRNKYFQNNIIKTKYNKRTQKYHIYINKILINDECFFDNLTITLIINEINCLKYLYNSEIQSDKIKMLNTTKKILIIKKINSKYAEEKKININTPLINYNRMMSSYEQIELSKINELFIKLYTKYEIRYLLEKYPILTYEFENDGQEKSIISILYDKYEIELLIKRNARNKKSKNNYELKKIQNLYEKILIQKTFIDGKNIGEKKLIRTIKELNYVIKFDFKSKILNVEKEKIIKIIINKYIKVLKSKKYQKYISQFQEMLQNIKKR